jgi:integrase
VTFARQQNQTSSSPAKEREKKNIWPNIYSRVHRSGSKSWVVDLGEIAGKRDRHSYKTKGEAETFAEQARIKKQNEGLAAFNISNDLRADALRASDILKPLGLDLLQAATEFLKARQALPSPTLSLSQIAHEYGNARRILEPHGVSLPEAIKYYESHVLRYKSAPVIAEIVEQMLKEAESNKRRDRTVADIRHRLTNFAVDFGDRKLTDLSVSELKEWVADEDWAPQTRINYLTKISQLFNYGIKHGWAELNLATRIDRPEVEDGEPQIFAVGQAETLLRQSAPFGLRPYIAIGLFAGLRSAELLRLKGEAIKVDEKVIIVGADVAKKRSRRVVEMCEALLAWLKEALPIKGHIVDTAKFRDNMDELKKACGLKEWPHNGLRHSYGSYHLASVGDQVKTAAQMGHRDSGVVHNHYKALVLKSEAEKYWALRPDSNSR